MLPLDALKDVRKIIVHDHCPDGIASALILQEVLPEAKLTFVQYSTPAHTLMSAEPGLLFCDFSPPAERVQEFVEAGAIVLDHHRTARPVVEAFGQRGVFGDEQTEPGVSGAVLAYREVWKPLMSDSPMAAQVEDFAVLCGIRDTWQKHHPRWHESCVAAYALRFPPLLSFFGIGVSQFLTENWDKYRWAGEVRYLKALSDANKAVKGSYRYVTKAGTSIAMFQGTTLTSDAAEDSAAQVDLIVGFETMFEHDRPTYVYSLRSRRAFDCAAFARAHGGGGHSKAAGFSMAAPKDHPFGNFIQLLETYENPGGHDYSPNT